MKNAQETKVGVDRELLDLNMTLDNIESARPFEELTVVCFTPSYSCPVGGWLANDISLFFSCGVG